MGFGRGRGFSKAVVEAVTSPLLPYVDYKTGTDNFGKGVSGDTWVAIIFSGAVNYAIALMALHLYRGVSAGNLKASIRATTGTPSMPTGSDIAIPLKNDVSGITTSNAGVWYWFNIAKSILPATADHALVLRVDSGGIYVKGRYLTTTGAGNARVSDDGGLTWSVFSAFLGKTTHFWYELFRAL